MRKIWELGELWLLYLLTAFFILFPIFQNAFPEGNATAIDYFGFALFLFLGFSVLVMLYFWLISSARAVFWRIKGYRRITLILYPFLIVKEGKLTFNLVINPIRLIDCMLPGDFLDEVENDYDEIRIYRALRNHEICGIVSQVILLVFASVILALWFPLLLPVVGISLISLLMLNTFKSTHHHAPFIKLKNLKRGFAPYYLAIDRLASSTLPSKIYFLAEQKINEDGDARDGFFFYKIQILTSIFMMKAFNENNSYILMPKTKNYIKANLLNCGRINPSSLLGSQILDFLKVYLCYAMIFDQQETVNSLSNELDGLAERCVRFGTKKRNAVGKTILLYVDFARHKRISVLQSKVWLRTGLIRRDRFLYNYIAYRSVYDGTVSRVTSMTYR